MIRSLLCLLLVLPLSLLAGCGGASGDPFVVVKGTILHGGQPMPMERADVGLGSVQLTLVPVGAGDADYANAAEDGTFEFFGAGEGVPPGEYRLAVVHNKSGPGADELKGMFSEDKSPITVSVPADKAGGTHDLGAIDLSDHGAK